MTNSYAVQDKYEDLWVDTSFGRTHLIKTGNIEGTPLLLFHGGNATTAYNLIACGFLMKDFCIYAVDTIGHPGKSAQASLSAKNYDYGIWASEVIDGIGYKQIACFGGSFGAGVLVKTMCVAPEKISKAMLLVPSAIKNAPAVNSISMMFPMIMYLITHKKKWFIKTIMPMAVTPDNITEDIYETARCSIDNVKIKAGMPTNADTALMKKFTSPVFVMAAERDCLFPGSGVIKRAKSVWPQCQTYILKNRGHMHKLSYIEEKLINTFLH